MTGEMGFRGRLHGSNPEPLMSALGQKRLGLLHELVAKGAVIGFLINPSNPNTTRSTEESQAAAEQLGHKLIIVKASTIAEIDMAFATLVQANVGGLVVDADAFFVARRVQITTLAARHGIPAIHPSDEFVAVGGLMSYASSIPDAYRSMGNYTARVLKGAKLADLPVLQPTKLELAISLSTAKALALTIPPGVLAIADEPTQCSIPRCYCNERTNMPKLQITGGAISSAILNPTGLQGPVDH